MRLIKQLFHAFTINSVAIVVFEALRQQGFPHLQARGKMADW